MLKLLLTANAAFLATVSNADAINRAWDVLFSSDAADHAGSSGLLRIFSAAVKQFCKKLSSF